MFLKMSIFMKALATDVTLTINVSQMTNLGKLFMTETILNIEIFNNIPKY